VSVGGRSEGMRECESKIWSNGFSNEMNGFYGSFVLLVLLIVSTSLMGML
jgi:hypothetical protein